MGRDNQLPSWHAVGLIDRGELRSVLFVYALEPLAQVEYPGAPVAHAGSTVGQNVAMQTSGCGIRQPKMSAWTKRTGDSCQSGGPEGDHISTSCPRLTSSSP